MTKYDWSEIERYFGRLTDREIADRFDVPRVQVANRRLANGVKVVTKWSKYEHLLGTLSDGDLAEIAEMKPNAVTRKRIRCNISRFNRGQESKLEDLLCSTLKEPFERQVITVLGRVDVLTSTTIYECKYRLRLSELHKAVGQLTCFRNIFPNRERIIVCAKMSISPDIIVLLGSMGIRILQLTLSE